MLRVRYQLLAFAVFALAVVGYIFFAVRSTSESFSDLVDGQARQVADLVAEVALRNDQARRDAKRLLDRLDKLTLHVLATQAGDLPRLRRTVKGGVVGRVLLVDAHGKVLLDEVATSVGRQDARFQRTFPK